MSNSGNDSAPSCDTVDWSEASFLALRASTLAAAALARSIIMDGSEGG